MGLDIVRLEKLNLSINQTFDFDLAVLLITSLLTLGVTGFSVWDPTGGTTFEGSVSELILRLNKPNLIFT